MVVSIVMMDRLAGISYGSLSGYCAMANSTMTGTGQNSFLGLGGIGMMVQFGI